MWPRKSWRGGARVWSQLCHRGSQIGLSLIPAFNPDSVLPCHRRNVSGRILEALADTGGCLILDCHSFPSVPLPYEINQDLLRPDICLGVDRQHTPDNLVESLKSWFDATRLQTSIDRPFAGTIVPEKHYGKGRRVWSIMIEVNRRLYMDEQTGRRLERFDQMRELLRAAARSERFRKILDN